LIARLPEVQAPPPPEVGVVAALADLADQEPGPGALIDPFDRPTGWRVGAPVATPWRFQIGTGGTVEVLVRGGSRDALVTVDGGEPQGAALRREGEELRLELGGVVTRWRHAREGAVTWLAREGGTWPVRHVPALAPPAAAAEAVAAGPLRAPLPGTVTVVAVAEGDAVTAGQTLLVLEAMKMEHPVTAPVDGVVAKLVVRPGQQVPIDAELAVVDPT
jgi:acetyl-CoA/propionyl-CoA carboxylase biotin carboxyl carrier protein